MDSVQEIKETFFKEGNDYKVNLFFSTDLGEITQYVNILDSSDSLFSASLMFGVPSPNGGIMPRQLPVFAKGVEFALVKEELKAKLESLKKELEERANRNIIVPNGNVDIDKIAKASKLTLEK